MSRLTKQERELLAQLSDKAKAEEDEDKNLEIQVRTESGHVVTLQGERARRFLRKHGLDEDDLEEAEEILEDELEEGEDELESEPVKRPAKKAAAPAKKAAAAPDKIPADEPPGGDSGGYFRRRG